MATLNLTPREAELLCGVIAVMKAEITWADVAAKANFTNAKQARDKWPAVRDKIIACGTKKEEKSETGEEAVGKVKGGATPKKPAANKRKAAGESTPAKTKKTKKAAAAEADDEEHVHVKPEADDGGEDDVFT